MYYHVLLLRILQVTSALSNQSEVQVCPATLYLLTYDPAAFLFSHASGAAIAALCSGV